MECTLTLMWPTLMRLYVYCERRKEHGNISSQPAVRGKDLRNASYSFCPEKAGERGIRFVGRCPTLPTPQTTQPRSQDPRQRMRLWTAHSPRRQGSSALRCQRSRVPRRERQ